MMRTVCAIIATLSLFVGGVPVAYAQDNPPPNSIAIISACIAQMPNGSARDACFGKVVDACMTDEPIIPVACWQAEQEGWDSLLNTAYQSVIAEITDTIFENHVRTAQRHWLEQTRLDCALQVMSNPQTYGGLGTACLAEATMKRVFFINSLKGATWEEIYR